jgi:hypothetical protein
MRVDAQTAPEGTGCAYVSSMMLIEIAGRPDKREVLKWTG